EVTHRIFGTTIVSLFASKPNGYSKYRGKFYSCPILIVVSFVFKIHRRILIRGSSRLVQLVVMHPMKRHGLPDDVLPNPLGILASYGKFRGRLPASFGMLFFITS
ncbi:hypothetical protein GIB67_013280, partial [Kingdonia uniflora]